MTDSLPSSSALSRADTITQYHTISKQLAAVDRDPSFPTEAAREMRRSVLRARLRVIGMDRYQAASREGEAAGGGFDSSKWVLQLLKEGKVLSARDGCVRLLDVGAIVHRFPNFYVDSSKTRTSLDVTSIDLHPAAVSCSQPDAQPVLCADLVNYSRQQLAANAPLFDALCLSLCVNFEGCPRRRGLMLYCAAQLLRPGGALILVLPRACIDNSRYCNESRLRKILTLVELNTSIMDRSNALVKCVAIRTENAIISPSDVWDTVRRKDVVRNGKQRNNFAICLDRALMLNEKKVSTTGSHNPTADSVISSEKFIKREGRKPRVDRINTSKETRSPGIEKSKLLKSNQRRKARRKAKRMQRGELLGS